MTKAKTPTTAAPKLQTLAIQIDPALMEAFQTRIKSKGYTVKHVSTSLVRMYIDGLEVPLAPDMLPSNITDTLSQILATNPDKGAEIEAYLKTLNSKPAGTKPARQ
jgi:hypothetical protein